MSTNMQAPPSQPPMPPTNPPPTPEGHGAFSDDEIRQIMSDTGYGYDQVCHDIDASGATSKEQLYPQLYSGQGIQPPPQAQGGMAESPGAVQGQPGPGGPPPTMAAPPEAGEGEPPQTPQAEAAEGEGAPPMGIDPKVAMAMHAQMRPSRHGQVTAKKMVIKK